MVTDLVIVGAGPCGLVSALLARQAGLSCVVLERRSEGQFFGHAHYLNQYSLRILAAAGVDIDSLAENATPVETALQMSYCTTFSHVFSRVSCFDDPLFRKVWDHADHYGTCLNVRFDDLMRAILAACSRMQVSILWECAFDTCVQNLHCSTSQSSPSSSSSSTLCKVVAYQAGQMRIFYASRVLACDGARSSVVTSAGVERKDKKVWQHFLSVEVHADLSPFFETPSMLVWIYNPVLQACMVMHDVSSYQVLQIPVSSDVTEKDLCQDRLRQAVFALCGLSGSETLDLSFGVVKTWAMQTFVLSSFVHGRLVFLGDSAHAMTPAGGLGLNTALADAANLIWKIAQSRSSSSHFWLSSFASEREAVADKNVQASIDNYLDFLSVPRCFGYDLLGADTRGMLNTYILPSICEEEGTGKKKYWLASWLSRFAAFGQYSLQRNRFFCEYLAHASASHLKHFRGLDQHLGFCYESDLIDQPHAGLGDYTLDFDIVRQGCMLPSAQVSMKESGKVLFLHELLSYPKWCLLSQVRQDYSPILPRFLSKQVDYYYCGDDYMWFNSPPVYPDTDIVLIRPDGIVAFLGDRKGLCAYVAKLCACVDDYVDDCGDGRGC